MSNIKIQDVYQRRQYTATAGQTVFSVPFPFFENSDLTVWKDETELTITTDYTVSGAGSPSGGSVTLTSAASSGDIITIQGLMPIDRTSIYSATISNLTGSDLNNDFNRDIVMLKQLETTQEILQLQYEPYAEVSQDVNVTRDRWIPRLGALQFWGMNKDGTKIEAFDFNEGQQAPADASYFLAESDGALPNSFDFGSLTSGLLKHSVSAGVSTPATAVPATDYWAPGNDLTTPNPPVSGTDVTNKNYVDSQVNNSVASGQGTSNQVLVNGTVGTQQTGDLVFTLPQDIATSSSPTFAGGTLTGDLDMQQNDLIDVRRLDFNTAWRLSDEAVGGVQRLLLQAQTGNQNAEFAILPIGTATQTRLLLTDSQNLNNYESIELKINGTNAILDSNAEGTGTALPLLFQYNSVDVAELANNGKFTLHSEMDANTNKIVNVVDPTAAQDAATKAYVDSRTDLHFMESVLAASTGNFASTYDNGTTGVGATLTASSNGAFTLDGEAGVLNARYLMKDQTTTFENGIYTLTQVGDASNPAILTRATDFDEAGEIDAGDIVPVLNGTVNGSTSWLQTASVSTVGTDAITFTKWSANFSNVVTIDGAQAITGSKTFTQTIDASSGVNFGDDTLNKYEQDVSWTPVLVGSTVAGSPTGTFVGKYTRIGDVVNATGQIALNSLGGLEGEVSIEGLPYPVINNNANRPSLSVGLKVGFTNDFVIGGWADRNTSNILMYNMEVSNKRLTHNDMSDTSNFVFSIFYSTSA